jgi:hypothetical protein
MDSTLVLPERLADVGATGVAITLEGAAAGGDVGALLIGFPGHERGQGPREGAAFVAVVGEAVTHDEGAEVGEAESEGAIDMGVLGNFLGRIAGVIHEDFRAVM